MKQSPTTRHAAQRSSWASRHGARQLGAERDASAAVLDATRRAYDEHHAAMQAVYSQPQFGQPSHFMLDALRQATEVAASVPGELSPRSVLDVGTGLGTTALHFAQRVRPPSAAIVIGMDVSAPCINHARSKLRAPQGVKLHYELADIGAPDTPALLESILRAKNAAETKERPFDLIYANATLHHLPPVDLKRTLRALASPRLCNPRAGVLAASFIAFGKARHPHSLPPSSHPLPPSPPPSLVRSAMPPRAPRPTAGRGERCN